MSWRYDHVVDITETLSGSFEVRIVVKDIDYYGTVLNEAVINFNFDQNPTQQDIEAETLINCNIRNGLPV